MNNLAKVIAFGGRRLNRALAMHYLFSDRGIPKGYIPLAYIESTGTQWIDTGFVPNQDTRVVCDFQFTVAPDTHWGVFGGRNGENTTNTQYAFGYTNNTIFRTDYNTDRSPYVANAFDAIGRHIVDKNKNITSLDGTLVKHTYTRFNPGYQLALFGINTANSVANLSKMRIYSCQIYDNGILVRDLKPCISPDGKVGMYDLVGRKFYGNASTGEFIAAYRLDDYVHDGANLFLDGIWNAGEGVHSDTLTSWVDLSGNCQPTPLGTGSTVGENCITSNGTISGRMTIPDVDPINLTTFTLELIYQKAGVNSSNQVIMGRQYASSYYVNVAGESLYYWTGGRNKEVCKGLDETAIHTLQVTCARTTATAWVDGVKTAENFATNAQSASHSLRLFGSSATDVCFDGSIFAVRLHNRILTDEELMQNYEIDKQRFGLAETTSVMMLGMPAETITEELEVTEDGQNDEKELGE